MNVSLGPRWEQFIEEKLRTGDYQSASELVCDGLRMIEQRDLLAQRGAVSTFEELQNALLVGVRSEPATTMTKADWEGLRAEVEALSKMKLP